MTHEKKVMTKKGHQIFGQKSAAHVKNHSRHITVIAIKFSPDTKIHGFREVRKFVIFVETFIRSN